ncbi:MAG: phosphoglycolate phosphatase [Gammaproteobacteria bacterium]
MSPVKLVLFDLDGTLIDSAPDLAAAVNAMLRDIGRAPQPERRIRDWIGGGGRQLIRRALAGAPGEPADEAFADEAYRIFVGHYARNLDASTRVYPGVREGFGRLRARGIGIGCVTNKPARFTDPILRALDLAAEFAVVVSGDTLPVMKPDPAPLLHAARLCGAAPAECAMVGDTSLDIDAARAAGIRAVWVSYGYSASDDPARITPDAVIDTIADIEAAL